MSAVDVAEPCEPPFSLRAGSCWAIADRLKGLIKLQESDEPPKGRRRLDVIGIQEEIEELSHRLAVDFGRRHGWTLSDQPFTIRLLARGGVYEGFAFSAGYAPEFCHHLSWYRAGRRAEAVTAHLYDAKDQQGEIMTWAKDRGLQASFPDYPSWWYPGWTTLVLYEAAER